MIKFDKLISILASSLFCLSLAPARVAGTDWSFNADVSLKESFDSNVYLQDEEPSASVTNAVQPFQESFVTSITPRAGIAFKPCTGFNVSGSYAPEMVAYHSESSESHVAHRAGLLFNGVVGKVTWQMQNSFTYIDGSEEGLTFGGPGGAPAIGGIPIRDRREALVYRNSFGAFHKHGNWFFRPAVSSYIHDFRTDLRDSSVFPNYLNYVDRNDFNLGLDGGYKAFKDGYIFLAYRCGWQHENELPPGNPNDYSNDYQRLLLGFEGKITDWLTFNLFAGPDWRNFHEHTPAGFDPNPLKVYIDGQAVLTLTKADSVTLTVKRFTQPAFGAPSSYEDITYDAAWRHRFNEKFLAMTGFKAYCGDWDAPVLREDWIFTPSASLTYTHNKRFSADFAYSYDWADSHVPNTEGREFTRHIVSLAVKYTF